MVSSRYYIKSSSRRSSNPQENPSSVNSLAEFQPQSPQLNTHNIVDKIVMRPHKTITIDVYDDTIMSNPIYQNNDAHYNFNTVEGIYTPTNSYIQPSVSGNYILPHGSIYFDERLTLDYLDKAVRTTEDNAYLAHTASQIANLASYNAYHDAERAGHSAEYHHHINGRRF